MNLLNTFSQGRMWSERGVTAAKVRKRNQLVFEKAPSPLADYVRQLIADEDICLIKNKYRSSH